MVCDAPGQYQRNVTFAWGRPSPSGRCVEGIVTYVAAPIQSETWLMSADDPERLSTLAYAQLLMCGSSCKTTFSNELWISMRPL